MEHVMNLYIICIKNTCHNFYGACYEFVYYMYKEYTCHNFYGACYEFVYYMYKEYLS